MTTLKKKFRVKPQEVEPASVVEGFDIPIDDDNAIRIDRLVNDYKTRIIHHLNDEYVRSTKWADRVADGIASFGGSWKFILLFSSFLVFWTVWNTIAFTHHFDGPPFILLNLILSFIAAFQAPIIMMSQNRQAARDKHESIIDFAINYKAEQEIDDMQGHLHRMEDQLLELKQMLLEMRGTPGVEKS